MEASLVVTLWIFGPMERAPAMTIQIAMMIQGCLPRTDHVMMRRMRESPLVERLCPKTHMIPGGASSHGSRRPGNRVP